MVALPIDLLTIAAYNKTVLFKGTDWVGDQLLRKKLDTETCLQTITQKPIEYQGNLTY